MKRFHSARFILNAIVALSLMVSLGIFIAPGVAEAQSPPGCTDNCFALDILKDKTAVHNCEYVTYKVCAANRATALCTNPCDINDVQITFTLPDGTPIVLEGPPGRDFPYDGTADKCYNVTDFPALSFHVDVGAATSIVAQATYSGLLMDSGAGSPAGATKSLTVTVLHPCIEVTKTPDTDVSKETDVITYNIEVHNCGDVDLSLVSITDDVLGTLTGSFASTLAVGAYEDHNFTHTVTASDPDPLVNTVTVNYQDYTGYAVSNTDAASVDLLNPSLTIDKTGPATAARGDTITYTFVIQNTSPDTALNRKSVTDTKLGAITASFPATLAIGESQTVNIPYTVKATDPDPLYNVVTAIYEVPELLNEVPASDDHSVDLLTPKLCIEKTVDCNDDGIYHKTESTTGPSDDADWKVVVWNCGEAPVYNIQVTDTNGYVFGSTFDLLNNGDKMEFLYTTTITVTTTNTATAVGEDGVGGTVGPVSSSATNKILGEGCLEICKFQDANVNGMWDPGEPWLPDWKFHVTGTGYDEWWTTGDDGCVLIEGLESGDYTVEETLKEGWYNTTPLVRIVAVETGPCTRVEFGNREEIRDIPPNVPAVNKWGIIAMITVFTGLLVWTVRRKRLAS